MLNMPVARAIAHRYRHRGLSEEDLDQVAYLALVKAARRFDPGRADDFLSFAVPTIRGELKKHFRDAGWSVRPPRRIQELQQRIAGARGELTQRLGRSPRPDDIAEELAVDVETVLDALSAEGCFQPSSLDRPVTLDSTMTAGDLVADESQDFASAEARVALAPAVRRLSDRDRRIIELRFFGDATQQEIADDIGVTQMHVSRLLARIFAQLRTELTA